MTEHEILILRRHLRRCKAHYEAEIAFLKGEVRSEDLTRTVQNLHFQMMEVDVILERMK